MWLAGKLHLPLTGLVVALALAGGAVSAQTGDADNAQDLPKKIQEKLTEQGFKDVKVVPGSYLVSATDKNGNPIMMMIGPDSMTMITQAPQHDQQAQSPPAGDKDQIIQQ